MTIVTSDMNCWSDVILIGHEVPTYVPEVAYDLWSKYLSGAFTNA